MSKRVRIIYHHEEDAWWAISPELPEVIAAADSREEVRQLVEDGLAGEGYEIVHLDAGEAPDYEAPTDSRFLADLGRVARPLMMIHGFRVEGNQATHDSARESLAAAGKDLTFA